VVAHGGRIGVRNRAEARVKRILISCGAVAEDGICCFERRGFATLKRPRVFSNQIAHPLKPALRPDDSVAKIANPTGMTKMDGRAGR